MDTAEKYLNTHFCDCENKYKERPPFCLGVIFAPDNTRSKETFAHHFYKKLRLGTDGKGRKLNIREDVKFIEVAPSETRDKKICLGHLNEGYPIVRLQDAFKMIVFIQRLHKKIGNWFRPSCNKTHAVLMIYQRRQEGKHNNDPIPSDQVYLELTKLIGNADPRQGGRSCATAQPPVAASAGIRR